MIPEIYPWFIRAALIVNATRHVFTNGDTGEAFTITIISPNDPTLGYVAGYVWISYEAMHLPWHPYLDRTYIEKVNVPYFEAQELPRWIFGELGIQVYDFLEAFNVGHDPHTPLHVRLGLPPFETLNRASLLPLPSAIPAGFHPLLPAAQPALPFGPIDPLLAAPPAHPAAPVAPLPVDLPAAPVAPAASLQAAPTASNSRSIAYEDLDLPKITIKRHKRKANPSSVRRMKVPLRLWEGFKQWRQRERESQIQEVRQDHLDGYLRFYLEEQEVVVPADGMPTEGYSVTQDFQYVQEGEDEEE
ncbi:MAG: hypothetical protein Q9207_008062 [Kuettlingeria erythrocarpa]